MTTNFGPSDLDRELARQEHILQHQIIEEICGGVDLAAALYPECYKTTDRHKDVSER